MEEKNLKNRLSTKTNNTKENKEIFELLELLELLVKEFNKTSKVEENTLNNLIKLLGKNDATSLYWQGLKELSQENYKKAIKHFFESAKQKHPTATQLYFDLLILVLNKENRKQFYKQILELLVNNFVLVYPEIQKLIQNIIFIKQDENLSIELINYLINNGFTEFKLNKIEILENRFRRIKDKERKDKLKSSILKEYEFFINEIKIQAGFEYILAKTYYKYGNFLLEISASEVNSKLALEQFYNAEKIYRSIGPDLNPTLAQEYLFLLSQIVELETDFYKLANTLSIAQNHIGNIDDLWISAFLRNNKLISAILMIDEILDDGNLDENLKEIEYSTITIFENFIENYLSTLSKEGKNIKYPKSLAKVLDKIHNFKKLKIEDLKYLIKLILEEQNFKLGEIVEEHYFVMGNKLTKNFIKFIKAYLQATTSKQEYQNIIKLPEFKALEEKVVSGQNISSEDLNNLEKIIDLEEPQKEVFQDEF